MLTARTFAKEKGISYTTIMAWLRDGLIPGAAQQETPMGMVWQIPASSLEKVERRKPGPKPATDTDGQPDQVEMADVAETTDEPKVVKTRRRASKRSATKKANVTKSAKKGARLK